MEYKIISTLPSLTAEPERLESLVNNAIINEGWQPIGGPVFLQIPQRVPGTYLVQMCQAMTR